jgi:cytochrome c5
MKSWRYFLACLLLSAAVTAFSQEDNMSTRQTNHQQQARNKTTAHSTPGNDGERVFEQNCSRCHNAPEGFSPRISGTIVRHMRVRAGLSKEDEQALLRFLNP